jgi:hypothetical protein
MRTLRVFVVTSSLAAAAAWAAPAHAYRPFDGTDADVADLGVFELELGPVHFYSQNESHYLLAPATVLNLGFLPRWELVADFQNYVALNPVSGEPRDRLLETDLLVKTVLVQGSLQNAGRGPSVALEVGPLLPNVNGEESFGASADLIVTQRWRPLTIHLNSWGQLSRGDLQPVWFEGAIIEGDIDAPVRPVSEWFVERDLTSGATTYSGLVGAVWNASDTWALDMALRQASIDGQRATEIRLGFTWSVEVWSPERRAVGRTGVLRVR